MGKKLIVIIFLILVVAISAFLLYGYQGQELGPATSNIMTVNPVEIDDVLTNPGMGFTSFNQIDGEMSYDQYPKSSIAYYRWYWKNIEPVQGNIQFQKLDELLISLQKKEQKLAFRIMAADGDEPDAVMVPQWLMELGIGGTWYHDEEYDIEKFMPDFNDAIFLEYSEKLIKTLGEKYGDHPAIDHVDVGFVGHWGEWHIYKAKDAGAEMPSLENTKKYIDWHLEAFPEKPVFVLIGHLEGMKYGLSKGAGWRADCFGDFRPGWNHMENRYPQYIKELNAEENWKIAPVAFETCGTIQDWYDLLKNDSEFIKNWEKKGRGKEYINVVLEAGLDYHISILNNKSTPIPKEWWSAVNDFLKKMGYRLVIKKLVHQKTVRGTIDISSFWENKGVAPSYVDYPLMYRLRDEKGNTVAIWESKEKIGGWIPGEHTVRDSFLIPGKISSGNYYLDIAIFSLNKEKPAVKLAIEGLRQDGWYEVSTIRIIT